MGSHAGVFAGFAGLSGAAPCRCRLHGPLRKRGCGWHGRPAARLASSPTIAGAWRAFAPPQPPCQFGLARRPGPVRQPPTGHGGGHDPPQRRRPRARGSPKARPTVTAEIPHSQPPAHGPRLRGLTDKGVPRNAETAEKPQRGEGWLFVYCLHLGTDAGGGLHDIGPDHPDYGRWLALAEGGENRGRNWDRQLVSQRRDEEPKASHPKNPCSRRNAHQQWQQLGDGPVECPEV